jgi:recombinational DNA repair protein RecT
VAEEKKKNQTAEEFFNVTTTGRRGVEDMLIKMGPEIQAVGADNVKESAAFETWKMRALVEVSTNEALQKYNVLGTRPGLFSVYQALAKSANMGLQFGGHFPQAYLVPKEGKAVLIVSEEGLAFIATYGPGAVLKVKPELHEVFDTDRFAIDDAARTYKHEYAPFAKDRGPLVGYFTVLEYKDGRKQIPYILQAKVRQIEKAYGGEKNQAYEKALEQMDRKTAMKALLRPVAREAEGLAMAYSLEEDPEPEMRNVTERTGERLKAATEALGPEHAAPGATEPLDVPAAEIAAVEPSSETPVGTKEAEKSAPAERTVDAQTGEMLDKNKGAAPGQKPLF